MCGRSHCAGVIDSTGFSGLMSALVLPQPMNKLWRYGACVFIAHARAWPRTPDDVSCDETAVGSQREHASRMRDWILNGGGVFCFISPCQKFYLFLCFFK